MDRQVTPPKQATSPTWGPAPPCKQALKVRMKCTSSAPKSPSGNWRYESLLVQSHWYENDFLFYTNNIHFRKRKGFALSLVLEVRVYITRT